MNKRKAFTIVELLIVLVIIALLVSILLPSFTMIRRMAKETAQKSQFATIDMALDAFKQDYGDYPPSSWGEPVPPNPQPSRVYCGAQKLTEALLGWDLMGFDPNTTWRRDGFDAFGGPGSYDPPPRQRVRPDGQYYTLFERRGPYLEVAKTPVFRLGSSAANINDGLYSYDLPAFFNVFDRSQKNYVICDVFGVKKITITVPAGTQTFTYTAGTPVLYYKANTNNKNLNCFPPAQVGNSIYNLNDNLDLIKLGVLPKANKTHMLLEPVPNGRYLCDPKYKIVDQKVPAWIVNNITYYWPNRPDTYLLISAGGDHEFGTNDDILNF